MIFSKLMLFLIEDLPKSIVKIGEWLTSSVDFSILGKDFSLTPLALVSTGFILTALTFTLVKKVLF